jgi:hypothetical protein
VNRIPDPAAAQTFKKRAVEIADHAHNLRGAFSDGVGFLQGLDETERQRMSFVANDLR